jgi:hypothetical protein
MTSAPNALYTGNTASAVSVQLPEGVQPTIPVRIANTKVMVDSQGISPASVPCLAEIVRSGLRNIGASV